MVTDNKTNHLRILVKKQKSDTKKKKSNKKYGCNTANNYNNFQSNGSKYHHRSNTSLHSNQNNQASSFNRANNKNQNNGYNNYRSNKSSINYNQTNEKSSLENQHDNDTGYVTVELKQFLEKVISENKMVIFFYIYIIVVNCILQI